MRLFLSVLGRQRKGRAGACAPATAFGPAARCQRGGGSRPAAGFWPAIVWPAVAGFALLGCAHTAIDKNRAAHKAPQTAKTFQAASGARGASSGDAASAATAAGTADGAADGKAAADPAAEASAEAAASLALQAAAKKALADLASAGPTLKKAPLRTPAAAKNPVKAQRNLAFFSPSVLPFAKNRDMARFYSQWAAQFQEAVRHYRSAASQYKKAAKHFAKMSEYTKKRNDPLFRKHFEEAAGRLKAGDGFLAKARLLRKKK